MEKQLIFSGILSNKAEENPGLLLKLNAMLAHLLFPRLTVLTLIFIIYGIADFFNWNRVKVRYCDGASFSGDSEDKVSGLFSLFTFFYQMAALISFGG